METNNQTEIQEKADANVHAQVSEATVDTKIAESAGKENYTLKR